MKLAEYDGTEQIRMACCASTWIIPPGCILITSFKSRYEEVRREEILTQTNVSPRACKCSKITDIAATNT